MVYCLIGGSRDTSGSLAPRRMGRRLGGRAGDASGMMSLAELAYPLDVSGRTAQWHIDYIAE